MIDAMSIWRRPQNSSLPDGLYDEVVTEALRAKLDGLAAGRIAEVVDIKDRTDIDEQLVTMVRDAASFAIRSIADRQHKIAVAQELLSTLEDAGKLRQLETRLRPELLKRIATQIAGEAPQASPPRGSLLSSGLITNAHGESVLDHLSSEFATADHISLLCSFIKLSGLDKFRPLIEMHRALGRRFRVLTTTYMHATEARAIEILHRLGAEVRISYDDSSTRLHAKAWIFHRASEYSTAYVGSSNLSHHAQTEGLEWNLRIAQADQPDLLDEMSSVFERYWNDADKFEPFDGSEPAKVRLARALTEPDQPSHLTYFEQEPREWQKPILRELEQFRSLGRNRNLVVAATGTGKTHIAAFDYEALQRAGKVESLLFIAHRIEILKQAREIFRAVLRRPDFGELWGDDHRPTAFRHVFAMIQTLDGAELPAQGFDHVIVDEVHHAAACTYDTTLTALDKLGFKELVGLSATPERSDARVYDHHFPRPYVGNLRVWDAIRDQILVPFRYFVLDVEGVDLRDARWERGYVVSDLSHRLITAAEIWIRSVTRALNEYIARPDTIRALAFCVDKEHARVVAERLTSECGLAARPLTEKTPRAERDSAKADLASGKVKVLCTVDLFNEGVDIPDVNTIFLFRPTESTTVFLQQLGRGLRRTRYKDMLTVFDVTGRQHPKFRFDRHLREFLGLTPRQLRDFVEKGFGHLPSGCTMRFEQRTKEDILERIRLAIPSDVTDLRKAVRAADPAWDLMRFLQETEVDVLDLYRSKRTWTSLRAEVGVGEAPSVPEAESLQNVQKLLHVTDELRLRVWERLLRLDLPGSTLEMRAAGMLFAILFGPKASKYEQAFRRWESEPLLREEIRQLIPVLRERADRLPHDEPLSTEIPLLVHAEYLDIELSAAFADVTKTDGAYRHYYTGVEDVCGGRYDLLLVTLAKGGKEEHLKYQDFPLSETVFQWQSQANTTQDDEVGRRHIQPEAVGVSPLLFVRDTAKDPRGVTCAFRFLGGVSPKEVRGERPVTIEWELATPLRPEWVRKWSNVV